MQITKHLVPVKMLVHNKDENASQNSHFQMKMSFI